MLSIIKKDKRSLLVSLIFLSVVVWYAVLHLSSASSSGHKLDAFAGTYGILAVIGGISGLSVSRYWGGFKSVVGRAIILLSFGLLLQEFGQLIYAYYAIVKEVEVPYPSIGDIGYFGSVILYICATWQLAKASGIRVSLTDRRKKIIATVLPLLLLGACYTYFLRGYEFDWSHPMTVLLDFGYPLGQAMYIIIAFMTYLLSKKLLGGVMKNKVLLLLVALLVQYSADFNFLFQANRGSWTTAGYGDMLYALSYALMAIALINMHLVLDSKPSSDSSVEA